MPRVERCFIAYIRTYEASVIFFSHTLEYSLKQFFSNLILFWQFSELKCSEFGEIASKDKWKDGFQ